MKTYLVLICHTFFIYYNKKKCDDVFNSCALLFSENLIKEVSLISPRSHKSGHQDIVYNVLKSELLSK